MAAILRGDVYWADLNPVRGHEQGGLRPVLVLSHDIFNQRSGTVIAVAITSRPQRAGYPLTLALNPDLLSREAWIKISQVRTISVERLQRRLSRMEEPVVDQVVEGFLELIQ